GRQGKRAERPPATLRAPEHAPHEELEGALELRTRRRLRKRQPLEHRLWRPARVEPCVAARREVESQQSRMAEALGHRRSRQGGELAERADAEPLERLRQLGELRGPRAQEANRQRREERPYRPRGDGYGPTAPARPRAQRR